MADCPEDLRYSVDHEWVATGNETIARVGITAYAADALGDIVFASLPSIGDEVSANDAIAELESTKSVSEVMCPVSGVIERINDLVADNPGIINEDPYGSGWLFEVRMTDPAELDNLLDASTYSNGLD